MKKLLTITFIVLFVLLGMTLNVQAADVTTWADLVDELANGTDTEVTLTSTASVTDTQTLNLNGKTLTLKDSLVVDGGKLTITGNGTIVTADADPLINVKNGGTLILENGTYNVTTYYGAAIQMTGAATNTDVKTKVEIGKDASITANYPLFIPKYAAFGVVADVYGNLKSVPTTKPGTEEVQYGAAIYINGLNQETTGNVPVINIYDGATLLGVESEAIYAAGYGIWNISGGYFEGTDAISIKGGEFNITGGTFKAYGEFDPDPAPNANGSEATGSAISVTGNDKYAGKVKLNISNATVESEKGYAVYETITNALQPAVESMKITSGDFSGKEGAVQADNIENFVEGGTFNSEVNEKYLSGTVESAEEDGTVLVGTKHTIEVKDATNGTVTASLTEAIKGQTVALTTTPADGYELKSLKVITAADSEVEVVEGKFVMPDMGVIVIAEFEETSGAGDAITEEKDETPKMGAMNASYVWIALVAISLVGIVTTKKVSKHSK